MTTKRTIPAPAKIESFAPIKRLETLARREGNAKKPVYEMHKWWARRLSSNFRMLLLGATSERGINGQTLWKQFYEPHDLEGLVVMDPFMGGGTSIVEATKMGARAIGSDIDPVAWFVTKKEVEPFDRKAFDAAFQEIEKSVATELSPYYSTVLRDGRSAIVTNFFWVATLPCARCSTVIELHPHYVLWQEKKREAKGKRNNERARKVDNKTVFCKGCHAIHVVAARRTNLKCECGVVTAINEGPTGGGKYHCTCGHEGKLLDHVEEGKPLATRLFALEWEITDGTRYTGERGFATATDADRQTYAAAEAALAQEWEALPIPKHKIPTQDRRDPRPVSYGFAHYHQLFNARQKLALGKILQAIRRLSDESSREYLLLAFSDSLASNNMLCPYAFGYRKLTPLFGLHAYRMITRPVEGNTWGALFGRGSFKKCAEKVARGKEYCAKPYEYWGPTKETRNTGERIEATTTSDPVRWRNGSARTLLLNRSSASLAGIEDGEVDIILTDPPYYNNLPYSEMSDFYFAWIRDDLPSGATWRESSTPYKESLFVQKNTEEQYRQYAAGMSSVFTECKRVLNPNGLMVFTYHHLDPRAWLALSQALNRSGFLVTHAFPLLAEGKSGFHSTEGNIKWDAVFCCRPREVAKESSRRDANWTRTWKKAVRSQIAELKSKVRLGKADKRSFAMALTIAEGTSQPIEEGGMFLLLRETADIYATKRLKLRMTGHVRPHRTRTAKWFVKEDQERRPAGKKKRAVDKSKKSRRK